MSKEIKPYQIMISILNNFSPSKEQKQTLNPFFFVRWLSNERRAIHIGNVFNRYYKEIPIHIQYDIAKLLLHKKIKFINFPKKEMESEKTLENIAKYYKISLSQAQEYFDIMSDKEKQKFKTLYDGA